MENVPPADSNEQIQKMYNKLIYKIIGNNADFGMVTSVSAK